MVTGSRDVERDSGDLASAEYAQAKAKVLE
jgi:hypothetical protein